jgi:hypothetical protein
MGRKYMSWMLQGLYASSRRLGGVMVWALPGDSPKGGVACPKFDKLTNLVCGLTHCYKQADQLLKEREFSTNNNASCDGKKREEAKTKQ